MRRRIILIVLLLGSAILWIVPSDVVELVARQRPVLLGRYSLTQFTWMLVLTLACAAFAYVAFADDARRRKLRAFRLSAALLTGLVALVAADGIWRCFEHRTYQFDRFAFRRPPGIRFQLEYVDRPKTARTYPHVRPGYGRLDCVFTIDKNGYRNRTILRQYDIVALGDSFTEGSRVTDDQPWPVRLAEISGRTVYSLGMSGYSPLHELAALRSDGLRLKPRIVLCALYEGNDFHAADDTPTNPLRLKNVFGTSPIFRRLKGLIVDTLGPIRAHAEVEGLEALAWIPVAVPAGAEAKYYAFDPKLIQLRGSSDDEFRQQKEWHVFRKTLSDMQGECRQAGAELVVVFIPHAAHVVLPLVADQVSPEALREFAAVHAREALPNARRFRDELLSRLPIIERVVADYCRSQSISFLSLTPVLQESARAGRQVYFTYDIHWTPIGHEVAARAIAAHLESSGLAERPGRSPAD